MSRYSSYVLLCLPFVLLLPIDAVKANNIPVDTNADDVTTNGNCTLREAIQAANTNLAVDQCPAGDASPTVDTIDLSAISGQTVVLSLGELSITEEVTINGPFLGNPTISGNNASRVFNISANTSMTSLNVSNGFVVGDGGGILMNGSNNLTLTDVNVTSNTADGGDGDGGGIYNGTGTLMVTGTFVAGGSLFSGNVAEGDAPSEGGGAIFNDGGTVTITDVGFRSNLANVGASGNGGGIYNSGGILTVNGGGLTGGDFTGNHANRAGGAIESNGGEVILNDVEFTGNTTGVNGGGLHVTADDTVTVDGGTFSGNVAGQEGGGLWNSALGEMTIQNGTIIDGNTANAANAAGDAQGGGGLFNNGGTMIIDGSTTAVQVINNVSNGGVGPVDDGGGGIFNDGRNNPATLIITNAIIQGNTAIVNNGNGGGLLNLEGTVTFTGGASGAFIANRANRAGGGLETNNGMVNLIGVDFINDTTGVNGGGLHVTASDVVTIDGGMFSGNEAGQEGGGIWNSATGTMTIQNGTTIDNNTALVANAADAQGGGGIFNNGGSLSIEDAAITNNEVVGELDPTDGGGGVFNDGRNTNGANVTITNTTIDGNTVNDTNAGTIGGRGGGILTVGTALNVTTLSVTGGSVSNNTATQAGGGIETNNSRVTLENVSVVGDTVGVNGGGLHSQAADTVTIIGGTFSENRALQEGGGLWNSSVGVLTVDGTTISNNIARAANGPDAQGGGGVFNNGGTLTIENATIANNQVVGELDATDGGGGVFNDGRNTDGANVTITNTTISNNSVNDTFVATIGGRGGGIQTIGSDLTHTTLNVTGGTVSGNDAAQAGGGIATNRSTVMVTNVSVNDNSVGINGGGVHAQSAQDTVTVGGGMVAGNTAGQEGGGLWNAQEAMLTILNGTVIDDNTANTANDAGDAQGGGGIFNNGGTVVIDGSSATVVVSNNTSTGNGTDDGGGGIFNNGLFAPAEMTITRATISGNQANGTSGSGGGILNLQATLTLTDVTVSENSAQRAGNGIEDNEGTLLTINTSTIANNLPGNAPNPGNGGGLHVTGGGTVEINTSTISSNTAANEGGGVWNSASGSIDVTASTVVMNATGTGGGFFNDGGTFTFDNTILGNNAATTAGPDCSGAFTSNDYNLIENTSGCTVTPQANDITGLDPDLGPLQDNGGPTHTHAPVYPTSPVIDQGNSAGAVAEATGRVAHKSAVVGKDQRGFERMVDDVTIPNAGNASDIGSMELNEEVLPVELTSFDAILDREVVSLTWTTASETNNSGFDVEYRPSDAETFERLDFVAGAGTTHEEQTYSYRVDGLDIGRHTFRLKQIDFDGSFAYSPEVEVAIELAEAYRLSAAYPNPFNPQTRFTLAVRQRQDVRIEVYNSLGQRVKTLHEGTLAANETHRFRLDAGSLPSGMYLIRTQGVTFAEVRRVTLLK